MDFMFNNATAFNQNLCHFGDGWPFIAAWYMFVGSGCPVKTDPTSAGGPWCAVSACPHRFVDGINPTLGQAVYEYKYQGCYTNNLNCQARSDYGGAVSPS